MVQPVSRDADGGDGALLPSHAAIVVGLGAGGWYLWQEQHAVISALVMHALHGQMQVIHLFTNRDELADTQVLAANPTKVTAVQLLQLAREVGRFFLVPAIALVLGLALICFRRAAPMRFSRRLDLDGLLREQARVFRSPAAFVSRRLGLVEIRQGEPRPVDLALNASEWIARWAADKNGGFNESMARKELGRQLGDVWRGLDRATPHIRCLLAVFALHGTGQRGEALKLLGDLSDSLAKADKEGAAGPNAPLAFPGALVARVDKRLADPEVRGDILKTMARHGFTTPGLMSVLIDVRRRAGVLAPAHFAFLKLVDRRLWYALHSLGFPASGAGPHPSPRVEAIGARDHWAAECALGDPLPAPSIDRAIEAVRAEASGQRDKGKR